MPVNYVNNLATVVRRQRKLSGLSQSNLARLAGVGKTAVFDLEHAKGTMRLHTVTKILAVLNIKLSLDVPIVHEAPNLKSPKALTTDHPTK